nr:hypothetical protein L204_01146 [Cryptococcus depauperatus CBS 7855]
MPKPFKKAKYSDQPMPSIVQPTLEDNGISINFAMIHGALSSLIFKIGKGLNISDDPLTQQLLSTWSDLSKANLRGSQVVQFNAGMSLMQSFGGPLPLPKMFVRWFQLGVTHTRFCIHNFKPDEKNLSSTANTNTPWMYPAVLPIIREAIKWRYEHLSYFHSLIWELHDHVYSAIA